MNEMRMTARALYNQIRGRKLTAEQIKAFYSRLDALPMDEYNRACRSALAALANTYGRTEHE